MRFKHRYFLYHLHFDDGKTDSSLQSGYLYKVIKDAVHANFGEYGLGNSLQGLQVKYYNSATNLLIVRAARSEYRLVEASITFIQTLKNRDVNFLLLHIGGSIRSCQKAAIELNQSILTQLWKQRKMTHPNTGKPLNEEAEKKMAEMKEETENEIRATET